MASPLTFNCTKAIMQDRINTLERLSGLTVTHRKEKSQSVYEFKRGNRTIKTCFTYDKAKMFAEGIDYARNGGLTESKKAVLFGMALLGATNAERSVYENVVNGKEAFDEVVAEKLIIKDGVYFVLSPTGRQLVRELSK